jgi:hypothetical protein
MAAWRRDAHRLRAGPHYRTEAVVGSTRTWWYVGCLGPSLSMTERFPTRFRLLAWIWPVSSVAPRCTPPASRPTPNVGLRAGQHRTEAVALLPLAFIGPSPSTSRHFIPTRFRFVWIWSVSSMAPRRTPPASRPTPNGGRHRFH